MNRSIYHFIISLSIVAAFSVQTIASENGTKGVSDARFARLAKGGNISGWLWLGRGPIEEIDARFSDEDFKSISSMGLTHVRVPIEFNTIYDENSEDLLNQNAALPLDRGIKKIVGFGLAVVVDLHSIRLGESGASDYSGPLDKDPEFVETFIKFWSSFAKRLSRHDPEWVFIEPMNEPVFRGKEEEWPPIQERLIKAIRKNAPQHTILATSAQWSNIYTFVKLKPIDDPNVVYNFHYYLPFYFTHQGATWSSDNVKVMRRVPYPSSPELVQKAVDAVEDESIKKDLRGYGEERWNAERIERELAQAAEWAKKHNVRITCNEFGAYKRFAPEPDRTLWTHDVRVAFEKYNIGWTIWDVDGAFGGLQRKNGVLEIMPGYAKALGLKTTGK